MDSAIGFTLVLAVLLLSACSTKNPALVQDNYRQPKASIKDSAKTQDASTGELYFVKAVNGIEIDRTSLFFTKMASRGLGSHLNLQTISTIVKPQQVVLNLVGTHVYALGIQDIQGTLSKTTLTAERLIRFTPKDGAKYVVKGILSAQRKDVWIEDEATGQRIDGSFINY